MCMQNATCTSALALPFLFDIVAFHALNVIRKSVHACMNSSCDLNIRRVLDESSSLSIPREFQVSSKITGTSTFFFLRDCRRYRMFTVIRCIRENLLSFRGYVLFAKCYVNT